MANLTGHQFGNYQLLHLLGEGGFAQVYLAEHLYLKTQVAIKVLHSRLEAEQQAAFLTEAQTIGRLKHPRIVRVLDFGVAEGMAYLVMDYAPKGTLRQRLPRGTRLPIQTILPYVQQVSEALHYAHEQKVVHRDVKPENLLVGEENSILLSDFGIATVAQTSSYQRTQGFAGTAAYSAPEQLQGKPVPASDQYALGIVIYEWLSGTCPFSGSPLEIATQQVLTPPPPLREQVPLLSGEVEYVVMQALSKDPKERFRTIQAFATALMHAAQAAEPAVQSSDLADASTLIRPSADLLPDATPRVTPLLSTPPTALPTVTPQLTPPATAPTVSPPALTPTVVASSPPASGTPGFAVKTDPGALAAAPPPVVSGSAPVAPPVPLPTRAARRPRRQRFVLLAAAALLVLVFGSLALAQGRTPFHTAGVAASATTGRLVNNPTRASTTGATAIPGVPATNTPGTGPTPTPLGPTPTGTPVIASSATVTITAASANVSNTFTINAVTGTPGANQVQARVLSANTQTYQQTVPATGQGTVPGTGTHATGSLSIDGNEFIINPGTYNAGTVFSCNVNCKSNTASLHMVLDQTVTISNVQPVIVPAHVQEVGSIGNNIANGDWRFCPNFSGVPRCDLISISVSTTFTGGVDLQTYTYVQQSDIDGAANSLISANQPNAQQVLQPQLHSNERFAGTPGCSPNVSANQKAGDQVAQVTVSVYFSCTGEVYDYDGAITLAAQLLANQAATNPGPGYALVGQISTSLNNVSLAGSTVTLSVGAVGVWVYQISASQKQAWANAIAGKSQQAAQSLLASQAGVSQVTIQLTPGNAWVLPTSSSRITIVVV